MLTTSRLGSAETSSTYHLSYGQLHLELPVDLHAAHLHWKVRAPTTEEERSQALGAMQFLSGIGAVVRVTIGKAARLYIAWLSDRIVPSTGYIDRGYIHLTSIPPRGPAPVTSSKPFQTP